MDHDGTTSSVWDTKKIHPISIYSITFYACASYPTNIFTFCGFSMKNGKVFVLPPSGGTATLQWTCCFLTMVHITNNSSTVQRSLGRCGPNGRITTKSPIFSTMKPSCRPGAAVLQLEFGIWSKLLTSSELEKTSRHLTLVQYNRGRKLVNYKFILLQKLTPNLQ